jgi:hypothetical protein
MERVLQSVFALIFILTFQIGLAADAVACSCMRATRQELRNALPLSFDGRVVATKILGKYNSGTFQATGALQATVKVVRKIKGEVASEVSVFTYIDGRSCGAAEQLWFARAQGRVLEFGVQPNNFLDELPANELVVLLCSLSSSELDGGRVPYLLR